MCKWAPEKRYTDCGHRANKAYIEIHCARAVNVMSYGARPVGAAMAAWLAAHAGVGACLVVAVAGFALQLLCIVQSPAVRLVRQPRADDASAGLEPA